jgi:SMI1-KNR4 cell-wall
MTAMMPVTSQGIPAGYDPCDDGVVPAAREEQITVVEGLIGLQFPAEHRRLLLESDGWSTTYGGDTTVQFLGIEDIRERYMVLLRDGPAALQGFVPFASDGSRELIGYDRRVLPAPVVMLDTTAADWSSAKLQGSTFDGFVARLESGQNLDFSTSYASPAT